MGQIEENNAFLLGMVSKGVVRVREIVEKGGDGGFLEYGEIAEKAIAYLVLGDGMVGYGEEKEGEVRMESMGELTDCVALEEEKEREVWMESMGELTDCVALEEDVP